MKMISTVNISRATVPTTLLFMIVMFGSAIVSNADTINFNTLEQAGSNYINVPDPYTESGYRISNGGALYFAQQSNYQYAGSAGLHERIANGLLTLARVDGGTFTLVSIDLSILANYGSSPPVTFTGFISGGGTVTQIFTPTVFGFRTFTFNSGFTNLTSVTWRQGTGEDSAHQFDNIVVSNVPEPASMILLGSGLLGIAGALRRRSRSQKRITQRQ